MRGEIRLQFCLWQKLRSGSVKPSPAALIRAAFDCSNLPLSKERSRKSKCSFCFFGPSGEIRTPGILNPNREINFFLIFFSPFRGLYSDKSCFPELSAPLFPSVRILSMVKNVVKSASREIGKRFVHLENLFKAVLPRGTHHLLDTSHNCFFVLRTDGEEVVPKRCLGEF